MLTYALKKSPGVPLYEALYRCIREDILSGTLLPGQKLPSQRALAAHLEVSKITVEAAYDQLAAEGYIRSRQRQGYFVERVERLRPAVPVPTSVEADDWEPPVDLTGAAPEGFPFSVWSRLQRQVMLDMDKALLLPLPNQGVAALRTAIAVHLAQFRGLRVDPGCILVGAGTDFLYNLLIQLLGRDKVYGVEEPGYSKIRRIYAAGGVRCVSVGMDGVGVLPEHLGEAQVLHISPSHHFPTGIITPLPRRLALLAWAKEVPGRYIIEDDYDSEFRFAAHPMPTMASLDDAGRVIYLNTFSKTLAPSIRISYMVLPEALMERFRKELGFYSGTVPSFEQYTLARFLEQGHFEKHINRMRKAYRTRRNQVLQVLKNCPHAGKFTILEQDAGLHFLLKVDTREADDALVARWARQGIRVRTLGSFYHGPIPREDLHCLVVNYSGIQPEQLPLLEKALGEMEIL